MVHTLQEIQRVLIPNGILLDLRPIMDRWPIEVSSARDTHETGRIKDYARGLEDDEAANTAIAKAEKRKWFIREHEQFFPLIYSWDSANEMEEWIQDEWDEFVELDEDIKKATRSAWALGDGDMRVRMKMKMLITKWRKHPIEASNGKITTSA